MAKGIKLKCSEGANLNQNKLCTSMMSKGLTSNILGIAMVLSWNFQGMLNLTERHYASRLSKGLVCNISGMAKSIKLKTSRYVEDFVELNKKDTMCIRMVKRTYLQHNLKLSGHIELKLKKLCVSRLCIPGKVRGLLK